MTLTLYGHPLSLYCMKAATALYENDTPFDHARVDFGDSESAAAFRKLWPLGKIPVLRDEGRGRTVPETTIIIEYLAVNYPGPSVLVPADPNEAVQARLRDRFFDNYVATPMQKIVADRMRPDGQKDSLGVAEARALLETAYGMIDADMAGKTWAMGETFTLADCAAGPALFYAVQAAPPGDGHEVTRSYLERLKARPSFARALKEAEPFFHMVPQ